MLIRGSKTEVVKSKKNLITLLDISGYFLVSIFRYFYQQIFMRSFGDGGGENCIESASSSSFIISAMAEHLGT